MPGAAASNSRRRPRHEPSLQDGIHADAAPPGTVCRAAMKGPVGTEDSDKKSGTVDKSQGVSPDLYIHFPLFVPTGRLLKARHAVPGRDSLESARPEGTPHAGEVPNTRHCVPGWDERSRWGRRFLRPRGNCVERSGQVPCAPHPIEFISPSTCATRLRRRRRRGSGPPRSPGICGWTPPGGHRRVARRFPSPD